MILCVLKRKRGLYKEFIGALFLALILTGVVSFSVYRLTDLFGLTSQHMTSSELIEEMEERYYNAIDDYFYNVDTINSNQIQEVFDVIVARYKTDGNVIMALVSEEGDLIKSNELVVIIEQTSEMNHVVFVANDDKSNIVYPLIFDKSRMYRIYDSAVLNKSLQRTMKLGENYLIIYTNVHSDINSVLFFADIILYFIIISRLKDASKQYYRLCSIS